MNCKLCSIPTEEHALEDATWCLDILGVDIQVYLEPDLKDNSWYYNLEAMRAELNDL